MDRPLQHQDAWARAKARLIEGLSEEEKRLFYKATPESLFYDASAAQKVHKAESTSRRAIEKLQPMIGAIEEYGKAMDVYSNASPLALSPLWGSIRVVLHVGHQIFMPDAGADLKEIARACGDYFEKLVDMFSRIGDVLPGVRIYERLFSDNERLLHLLSEAYVDIITFCSKCKAVFRRGQRGSSK